MSHFNEKSELLNATKTNLIDIIVPPKQSEEKEVYEFQDEIELINELNQTIHHVELSLAQNSTEKVFTNLEKQQRRQLHLTGTRGLTSKSRLKYTD